MTALAIIGLVLGLVVFCLVVYLLNETLKPLLKISEDVQSALTAPMLERGVPGTELIETTRRLVDPVPGLAGAYLQKLGLVPPATGARRVAFVLEFLEPVCGARPTAGLFRGSVTIRHEAVRTMSAGTTVIAALSDNQNAWALTLGAGLVILLVVLALLEMLRRTVVQLNDDIWQTWLSGKAVVKNTAMTYLLKNTRDSGGELVDELSNHR